MKPFRTRMLFIRPLTRSSDCYPVITFSMNERSPRPTEGRKTRADRNGTPISQHFYVERKYCCRRRTSCPCRCSIREQKNPPHRRATGRSKRSPSAGWMGFAPGSRIVKILGGRLHRVYQPAVGRIER
ncbi:hypothetical protein BQ8482_480116 [Mesorhizobium delmotii]|uniref:Uncharacterized protein n=1 Tax=Mesorhizobium delmotii TaxID=1631247 RepID=A0A2P9ATY1_9HYPH|nr:hypothetical protein BQ8482_480116 [Mesorhizobium delmotii]